MRELYFSDELAKLHNASELLDSKYGAPGTENRKEFDAKALAYYYSVILRDRRKELKMTQNQLAASTGMARSYIAKVERGETDIQLSSFLRIADALQMTFMPKISMHP
ncbi:MAG: helix-turn-helix transcriptional regulator [Prevotella sp.]|nr:helix-turn-helix transcriptional regulator [Prevotella sp.]MCI1282771.1 helix-turn-helix transcriptional regulator [Prevotella sp.]